MLLHVCANETAADNTSIATTIQRMEKWKLSVNYRMKLYDNFSNNIKLHVRDIYPSNEIII